MDGTWKWMIGIRPNHGGMGAYEHVTKQSRDFLKSDYTNSDGRHASGEFVLPKNALGSRTPVPSLALALSCSPTLCDSEIDKMQSKAMK